MPLSETSPGETPFHLAQRLRAEGLPRPEVLQRLRATGLDDEGARVALNAVDGLNPSALPEASLSPGINPLAPRSFALSDLGLSGPPRTVALYWMAFGAVMLVVVAAFLVLPDVGIGDPLGPRHLFWARVGLALGALAFGWGVLRLAGAVLGGPDKDA